MRIARHLDTFDYRSAAIDSVMRELRQEGLIRGWRDEYFSRLPPNMALSRCSTWSVPACRSSASRRTAFISTAMCGATARSGCGSGGVPTNRPIEPGKLDHLVAGGLPTGIKPFDNLIKEAAEEATIPKELARRARSCGALSYRMELDGNLRDDTIFVYDLELPADFVPKQP